ncbi:cell division cycle 2-like [Apostasia shenzhenica]|uniref:Cell division cycle 2-like n=1 Tax=Apostasia shenzhenica TaxID=1088818 RepID=A0A2I0AJU1_9ASPA|nr:cell division cycle 2-like [Apostasia shenzhenica]
MSHSIENHGAGSFEFNKAKGMGDKGSHHCNAMGFRTKLAPSKWDDAQKWLVGFSGGGGGGNDLNLKNKARNSNAEDRRLLHSASQRGRDSCSSADVCLEEDLVLETKKMDCRISHPVEDLMLEVKSASLRDVGTEMTPIASQEPSRTATPVRATTPVLTSPTSSRSSTPGRYRQGVNALEIYRAGMKNIERKKEFANGEGIGSDLEQIKNRDSLESRAMAWDEAERAKYMARQKSRAQEKLANNLAATRRIAEEKRANAQARLNERAARTAEKADYIRRTGHLPSSFFFLKLPSLCG